MDALNTSNLDHLMNIFNKIAIKNLILIKEYNGFYSQKLGKLVY